MISTLLVDLHQVLTQLELSFVWPEVVLCCVCSVSADGSPGALGCSHPFQTSCSFNATNRTSFRRRRHLYPRRSAVCHRLLPAYYQVRVLGRWRVSRAVGGARRPNPIDPGLGNGLRGRQEALEQPGLTQADQQTEPAHHRLLKARKRWWNQASCRSNCRRVQEQVQVCPIPDPLEPIAGERADRTATNLIDRRQNLELPGWIQESSFG